MDEQDNSKLILGIIIFVFILIAVIIVINITRPFDRDDDNNDKQARLYSFQLSAKHKDSNINNLKYTLKDIGGVIVQDGVLEQGIKTEFNEVKEQNYTFEVETDEFYHIPKLCDHTFQLCEIELHRTSKPNMTYHEYSDFYRVTIYQEEGILQDASICIGENTDRMLLPKPIHQILGKQLVKIEPLPRLQGYYECYRFVTETGNMTGWYDLATQFTDIIIEYQIKEEFEYVKGDRLRILLVDLYNDSWLNDVNNNDMEMIINLY